jgi:hypothetical protein
MRRGRNPSGSGKLTHFPDKRRETMSTLKKILRLAQAGAWDEIDSLGIDLGQTYDPTNCGGKDGYYKDILVRDCIVGKLCFDRLGKPMCVLAKLPQEFAGEVYEGFEKI